MVTVVGGNVVIDVSKVDNVVGSTVVVVDSTVDVV
jgi:hypothetical protein